MGFKRAELKMRGIEEATYRCFACSFSRARESSAILLCLEIA
jgi:hypothetical protein